MGICVKALALLWQRHRLLTLAFLGSLLVAGVFAVRFLLFVLYWHDPAHRDQPLEGWMTIGYVAHSYDVPRDLLIDALRLPPPGKGERPTLDRLAEGRGQTLAAFEGEIAAAIARLRAEDPHR